VKPPLVGGIKHTWVETLAQAGVSETRFDEKLVLHVAIARSSSMTKGSTLENRPITDSREADNVMADRPAVTRGNLKKDYTSSFKI